MPACFDARQYATAFNQPVSFDTSSVTDASKMFFVDPYSSGGFSKKCDYTVCRLGETFCGEYRRSTCPSETKRSTCPFAASTEHCCETVSPCSSVSPSKSCLGKPPDDCFTEAVPRAHITVLLALLQRALPLTLHYIPPRARRLGRRCPTPSPASRPAPRRASMLPSFFGRTRNPGTADPCLTPTGSSFVARGRSPRPSSTMPCRAGDTETRAGEIMDGIR